MQKKTKRHKRTVTRMQQSIRPLQDKTAQLNTYIFPLDATAI